MTSQHLETDEALLPTRQELIDYIVKLMPIKAHDSDQNTEHDFSLNAATEQRQSSTRGSIKDVSCVKDLLAHRSRSAYQFRADDYSAQIDGRVSFGTLVSTWELATKAWDLNDSYQFPNVRNGLKTKKYTACTVRCTCMKCGEGDPLELVCEPYAFGTARGCWPQVLVHKLHNNPENRAIVLGWGSDPDTYLIWGTHPTLPDAMAYNQNVVLKQVQPDEAEPSHSLRNREHAKKRRASDSTDLHPKAPKQQKTDSRQHRPFAPSPLHQSVSSDQLPVQPDLQQAWRVIMDHIIDQEDQDTGLSIMFSNHKLQEYITSAEAAAEGDNEYLFRTVREMIDEELEGTGFPRLPMM